MITEQLYCVFLLNQDKEKQGETRKRMQITYEKDCGSHGCFGFLANINGLCLVVTLLLSINFHSCEGTTSLNVIKWEGWN